MKKPTLSTLVLSISLAIPAFAAHHQGPCKHPCSCEKMQHIMKNISLTPSEKANINQIRSQGQAVILQNQNRIDVINQKIHVVTHTHPMNEQRLDALLKEKASLITDQMKTRIKIRHMIYDALTPEQQAKFKQMEASKMHQHQHNHHTRG